MLHLVKINISPDWLHIGVIDCRLDIDLSFDNAIKTDHGYKFSSISFCDTPSISMGK